MLKWKRDEYDGYRLGAPAGASWVIRPEIYPPNSECFTLSFELGGVMIEDSRSFSTIAEAQALAESVGPEEIREMIAHLTALEAYNARLAAENARLAAAKA